MSDRVFNVVFLCTGAYTTIDEMAEAEKINASYVCRILRLTLLAPDIVDAILDGRQPAEMTMAGLMKPFSVRWGEQVEAGLRRPYRRYVSDHAVARPQ